MKRFTRRALTVLLILCTSVSLARADEQAVGVSGDLNAVLSHLAAPGVRALSIRPRTFSPTEPIRLAATLPGGGSVVLVLDSALQRYWSADFISDAGVTADTAEVTLFRGSAEFEGETVPLAASIYLRNSVPTLFGDFASSDGARFFHLEVPLLSGGAETAGSLTTTTHDDLPPMSCGAEESGGPRDLSNRIRPRAGILGLRALEIATEADFEFFARYGTNSNTQIATIINAANTIYKSQLSLDVQIKSQHTVTTSSQPYTTSDSGGLLTQFRTYTNANSQLGTADVYGLFSGKDFDGSVIGVAYISVLCSAPTYSYHIVQDIGTLTYLVFAHELGHNLGADHDPSSTPSIMGPVLSGSVTSFSALSIGQIGSYVSTDGSCLSEESGGGGSDPTPTPTPTPTPPPGGGSNPTGVAVTLTASLSGGTLSAAVSASGATGKDCQAYLALATDISMSGAKSVKFGKKGSTAISGTGHNSKGISHTADTLLYAQAQYVCGKRASANSGTPIVLTVTAAPDSQKVQSASKWESKILSSIKSSAKKHSSHA